METNEPKYDHYEKCRQLAAKSYGKHLTLHQIT